MMVGRFGPCARQHDHYSLSFEFPDGFYQFFLSQMSFIFSFICFVSFEFLSVLLC